VPLNIADGNLPLALAELDHPVDDLLQA